MNTIHKYIYNQDLIDYYNFKEPSCKSISVHITDSNGHSYLKDIFTLNKFGGISKREGTGFWGTINFPNVAYTSKEDTAIGEANMLAEYKYNEQNLLVEISSRFRKGLHLYSQTNLEYKNGLIKSAKTTTPDNFPNESNESFDYDKNNNLIRYTRNNIADDQLQSAQTEEFLLDNLQRVTQKNTTMLTKVMEHKIDISSSTTYTYNDSNQLVKAVLSFIKEDEADGDDKLISTFKYANSTTSNISTIELAENNTTTVIEFTYDALGRVIKVVATDLNKNKSGITKYLWE